MHVYTLSCEQFVPIARNQVFAYFQEPENLAQITPSKLTFRLLTPSPIPMHTGSVIDYTIKLGLFPMRWTTLIADYKSPEMFTDIQIKGPYSFWHHKHHFEELSGGTIIRDTVHYALPFGVFGRLIHSLMVRTQLRKIFQYRHDRIQQMFG
jgi:ligand-binding SRPBCC domain-containing protein